MGFWTERQWKIWKKTPEAIARKFLPVYLEDKDGNQLHDDRIGKIKSTMYEVWQDLRSEGHIDAQMTWASMPLTMKKSFLWELANTFMELNYCKNLWKVDAHAKAIYLSWKQTWFTKKSGNAVPGKCMKVEEDPDEDFDETAHDSAATGTEGDPVEESPDDAAAAPFSFTSSSSEAPTTSLSMSRPIPHNAPDHEGDSNTGVWVCAVL